MRVQTPQQTRPKSILRQPVSDDHDRSRTRYYPPHNASASDVSITGHDLDITGDIIQQHPYDVQLPQYGPEQALPAPAESEMEGSSTEHRGKEPGAMSPESLQTQEDLSKTQASSSEPNNVPQLPLQQPTIPTTLTLPIQQDSFDTSLDITAEDNDATKLYNLYHFNSIQQRNYYNDTITIPQLTDPIN